jgi:hypothetical protein
MIEVEAAQLLRRYRLPFARSAGSADAAGRAGTRRLLLGPIRGGGRAGRANASGRVPVGRRPPANELGLGQRFVPRYPLWVLRHHPDRRAGRVSAPAGSPGRRFQRRWRAG